MRSWVPDVAEQGGGGGGAGPDEGTAMAAQSNPICDTARGVFTFPGMGTRDGKEGLGKVRGC